MLPNTDSDSISAFEQNVVAGYATTVMGFNEYVYLNSEYEVWY